MFDTPQTTEPLAAVETEMRRLLGRGRIAELAAAHLDSGGSRARALLATDTAVRIGLPDNTAAAIAACCELLHNASLIHDDIQDGDSSRRGQPALWEAHGSAAAICAGDLMISAAWGALAAMPGDTAAPAVAMVHEAVATTIDGQAEDIAACSEIPFERTLAIASAKSAPLLALPVRLSLTAARIDADTLAQRAAVAVAIAYQIADDVTDRDRDRAAASPNACLALEHEDHTADAARDAAILRARAALTEARVLAADIPEDGGGGLASLADKVEHKLDEVADAA